MGLSCLGSALLLQGTVIVNILQKGYFRGIEQNPTILWFEAFLTVFGAAYLVYLCTRFLIHTEAEDKTKKIDKVGVVLG